MLQKIVVILGPTASGKTDLSIKLAKKLKTEIISADSRQVYKKLDIGTGKITKKEMQNIPHHLLDVANPRKRFTVAQFQKRALSTIKKIHQKNKIPLIIGGTGFYIQSITDGITIPEVKPNISLRKKLAQKSTASLYAMLVKRDPKRAATIDEHNPQRLIRALEIIASTKKPIQKLEKKQQFEVLFIGIKKSKDELSNLIEKRLKKRLKDNAMINEVKNLHKSVSWKRLEELGLEYRYIAQYLQGKITKGEMINILQKEIEHYAKRQMTWFKRNQNIHWIDTISEAEALVDRFVNSKL